MEEYEEENNPIVAFIKEYGEESIVNESTSDVYRLYTVFCAENSMTPMSNIVFSKQLNKRLNTEVVIRNVRGKTIRIFTKGQVQE